MSAVAIARPITKYRLYHGSPTDERNYAFPDKASLVAKLDDLGFPNAASVAAIGEGWSSAKFFSWTSI